jgi:S1-C subfamily serine protease
MGLMDELQETIARLAGQVGPSVVGIGQRWGVGSGVVIGSGQVLTNAHNLRGEETTVTFSDGRTAAGTPAGVDLDGDLAVVSVDTGDIKALEWASNGASSDIGRVVFAISNPGGRGLRVSFGTITGTERSFRGPRGRRIAGSLEHTAPLLPGSSGGPVVDAAGALLGLNTNRLGEGFYLAIPADQALKERVAGLAKGEAPARPHLGIGIAPSRVAKGLRRAVGLPDAEGLLVRAVEDGSLASKAGLQEGDLIVAAGGTEVKSVDDLFDALDRLGADGKLDLKVLRGTEERTVSVSAS